MSTTTTNPTYGWKLTGSVETGTVGATCSCGWDADDLYPNTTHGKALAEADADDHAHEAHALRPVARDHMRGIAARNGWTYRTTGHNMTHTDVTYRRGEATIIITWNGTGTAAVHIAHAPTYADTLRTVRGPLGLIDTRAVMEAPAAG